MPTFTSISKDKNLSLFYYVWEKTIIKWYFSLPFLAIIFNDYFGIMCKYKLHNFSLYHKRCFLWDAEEVIKREKHDFASPFNNILFMLKKNNIFTAFYLGKDFAVISSCHLLMTPMMYSEIWSCWKSVLV